MLERERRRVAGGEHVRNAGNAPVGVDGDEPAGAVRQPWDRRADEARQRDHAVRGHRRPVGQFQDARAHGDRARRRTHGDATLAQQLGDRPARGLAEHPQRCGLWRDDRDLGLGPAVAQLGGGHDRQLVDRQRPAGRGRKHEREPRAVGERPRDGRRVGRAAERDRAVERRLSVAPRPRSAACRSGSARPSRRRRTARLARPARASRGAVRRRAWRRIASNGSGFGRPKPNGAATEAGRGFSSTLRGEQGDARQRPRERAQRCHRFDRGDTAARDDDRLRWCSVHGSTVRPPRDAAIRSPPRRPAGHDGSGDDMSRLGS